MFLISLNSVKTGIRCSVEISLIPQKDKQHHWKTMASLFLHLSYFKASKKVKTGIKCSIEVPLIPINYLNCYNNFVNLRHKMRYFESYPIGVPVQK